MKSWPGLVTAGLSMLCGIFMLVTGPAETMAAPGIAGLGAVGGLGVVGVGGFGWGLGAGSNFLFEFAGAGARSDFAWLSWWPRAFAEGSSLLFCIF